MYFNLIFCCCTLFLTQVYGARPIDPALAKRVLECYKELNINPYDVRTLDEGKLKCMAKCRAGKAGYIKENGEIVAETALALFSTGDNAEALTKCLTITHDDPCEKAYNIQACLYENSKMLRSTSAKIIMALKKCTQELEIPLPLSPTAEFTDKTKCLSACMAEQLGWMDATGDVKEEILIMALQLDAKDLELQKCFDFEEKNKCEKAFQVNKCVESRVAPKRK